MLFSLLNVIKNKIKTQIGIFWGGVNVSSMIFFV